MCKNLDLTKKYVDPVLCRGGIIRSYATSESQVWKERRNLFLNYRNTLEDRLRSPLLGIISEVYSKNNPDKRILCYFWPRDRGFSRVLNYPVFNYPKDVSSKEESLRVLSSLNVFFCVVLLNPLDDYKPEWFWLDRYDAYPPHCWKEVKKNGARYDRMHMRSKYQRGQFKSANLIAATFLDKIECTYSRKSVQ